MLTNVEQPLNLLPYQGEAFYYPSFFTEQESAYYSAALQQEIAWKQEPIRMFGKLVMQPRLTALYGYADKPYQYAGLKLHPLPWTGTLLAIKNHIETIAQVSFTSVLLNLYRDGKDSNGWHRDNEKELGTNPVIASVSFGSSRNFHFRHHQHKEVKRSVELVNGSFLLMQGETQHYWEHQIPKSAKVTKLRINLTFRVIH
ncbi:alpha-ketoglutarate-dependent dioxygenase AlkB [Mucilaginibacter robiniae]|uniref:Alpha-ketoglutarate-dependent dioxygenase AlkB n=1 Tax=Mucilaginibacter robiniae TaxID=2728022 RepID=A0A7L5E181_9SPHI|nr:alpha-ketoglutarate-dependent dioxygenase AlkB [Mucilaginibacter robiniae]QJD96137.1 alpha-ketoglutarate-dependent dioxygenase AlkB [Mucilaginibacter robiniae]